MTLEQAAKAIGQRVVYLPDRRLLLKETVGVIMSVNDTFVFVRYSYSPQSVATRPEDLEVAR